MGKESKEILRTILSNTEIIMAHLKLKQPAQKVKKDETPATVKRAPAKKGLVKKTSPKK